MNVAIGIFLMAAMVITLGASFVTNQKLWGLIRESRVSFRALPPERRRSALIWMVGIYALVVAEAAVVLTAPFGVRMTLTYFVILPFVVVVPAAVMIAGVRAFRRQRRHH